MIHGKYSIGLMSGTSMDGIDCAIVSDKNEFIYGKTYAFDEGLHHDLFHLFTSPRVSLSDLMTTHLRLGQAFAKASLQVIKDAKINKNDIAVIGSHGQTLIHEPKAKLPHTLQIGCAHTIAHLTQIPVVADFRTRDMVCNGQGAPFAPWYHQQVFKKLDSSYAVVNIGGISNLSYFDNAKMSGFDVGPGNCLLDDWAYKHLNTPYDKDGLFAREGEVDLELVQRLLNDPYFTLTHPKSIGREYFSLNWLNQALKGDEKAKNIQASLVELTAKSIIDSVNKVSPQIEELIICGGGVHNLLLIERLQYYAQDKRVCSSAKYNVSPDFLEAMMFAWLGRQFIESKPIDLRHITGATQKSILGAFYPATVF